MSHSLSQASLPVFTTGLNALSAILDKAEAYASAKKFDSAVLVRWRLAPDMLDFAKQIQIATDQVKNGSARLAGVEPPRFEDNEATIADLKARLAKTVAFLQTLDAAAIDASSEREITFPMGPTKKGRMKGSEYLNHFLLPNYYFHLAAAYLILRLCGVEIGKIDFIGQIPLTVE